MKIIITGPKASGKTTLGAMLAERLGLQFFDTDTAIENCYACEHGVRLHFREIYNSIGEDAFRSLERKAVEELAAKDWGIVSTGGGTMLQRESRNELLRGSLTVLLKGETGLLWARMEKDGLPAFLSGPGGFEKYVERTERLYETLEHRADIVFTVSGDSEADAGTLFEEIGAAMIIRMNGPNTFGEFIRTTTFGESHGPAVGAVLDGLKPGIDLSEEEIQRELDRRRPGQSAVTSPRSETDRVRILSGLFDGKTTGTPVCMVITNEDHDSSKYDALRDLFRPGHADFTFWKKYGLRDHRGGGRSSGRETAGRVASGAVAKKILGGNGIEIVAFAEEIAGIRGTVEKLDMIEANPVRAADPEAARLMEEAVRKARGENDSVGGVVKLIVSNVPAGLGDPVFFKLDARLGMALFSIGAVKGVEFGSGFRSSRLRGSENNDQMGGGGFLTNNAGGILGGISTGQAIVVRVAVKPTPSIRKEQKSVDIRGEAVTMTIEGRHDPCIVPRIIPVVEAMAALVILDALEIQRRIHPDTL
jgi:chorismate synthase